MKTSLSEYNSKRRKLRAQQSFRDSFLPSSDKFKLYRLPKIAFDLNNSALMKSITDTQLPDSWNHSACSVCISQNAPTQSTVECSDSPATCKPAEDSDKSEDPSLHHEQIESSPLPEIQMQTSAANRPNEDTNGTDTDSAPVRTKSEMSAFQKMCCTLLRDENFTEELVGHMSSSNVLKEFMVMMKSLSSGAINPRNVSLLAAMDVCKYLSCGNSSKMRYFPEMKQYWLMSLKEGGGSHLRAASGPKNRDCIRKSHCTRGNIPAADAQINFAIPSVSVLKKSSSQLPKLIMPGIIPSALNLLSKDKDYVLSVDGKSLSTGLLKDGFGDVDLWGEEVPTLQNFVTRLEHEIELISELSADSSREDLQTVIRAVTMRIKDLRESLLGFEKAKDRVQNLARENPAHADKYNYAMASINAARINIRRCISALLLLNKDLCILAAHIAGNSCSLPTESHVNLCEQSNVRMLLPPDKMHPDVDLESNPQYVKQGSDMWLERRRHSPVTASSLYNALGLRGSDAQRLHYKGHIQGADISETLDSAARERMAHGKKHEVHAFATVSALLMPALLPSCCTLYERGMQFYPGDHREKLMEESPDGRIISDCTIGSCTHEHGHLGDISLEIKSPYKPSPYRLPHYYFPQGYHFCQMLAQMATEKTDKCWFVSSNSESTVLCEVQFSATLWDILRTKMFELFDRDNLRCPSTLGDFPKKVKPVLDEDAVLSTFILAEVPTVTASHYDLLPDTDSNPFAKNQSHDKLPYGQYDIESELQAVKDNAKMLINEAHTLCRRKANEILIFILSDTDRAHNISTPMFMPIAYAMRGRTMAADTMRSLLDRVRDECLQEGLSVVLEAFDGQWANVVYRSSEGKPLTRLGVTKDVWKSYSRLGKESLVSHFEQFSKNYPEDLEDMLDVSQLQLNEGLSVGVMHLTKQKSRNALLDPEEIRTQVPTTYTYLVSSRPTRVPLDKIRTQCTPKNSWMWNQCYDPAEESFDRQLRLLETSYRNILDILPEEYVNPPVPAVDPDISLALDRDAIPPAASQSHANDTEATILYSFHEDGAFDEINAPKGSLEFDVLHAGTQSDSPTTPALDEPDQPLPDQHATDVLKAFLVEKNDKFLRELLDRLQLAENRHLMTLKRKRKGKWVDMSPSQLLDTLSSSCQLNSAATVSDLHIIDTYISEATSQKIKACRGLKYKYQKVNAIAKLFCSTSVVLPGKGKFFQPKRLDETALKVVKSPKYPRLALCVAASYVDVHDAIENWERSCTVPAQQCYSTSGASIGVYYNPELDASQKPLFKLIDPTHILTNLRAQCCRKGIPGMANTQAWIRVSEVSNSVLSRAVVVECVDKQNASIAKRFFSSEVEQIMRDNGDFETAEFVKNVRQFYCAVDSRGVHLDDRISHLVEAHKYFQQSLKYTDFPPPGAFVNGIPTCTFEAIMVNISVRLSLYANVKKKTYNHRSLSTLCCEQFFSKVASYTPTGMPKSVNIPKIIGDIMMLNWLRYKPDK